MSASAPEWITVSQAAAHMGVSERTIRRRASAGKLRARLETTANGSAWLIDATDLRTPAAIAADTVSGAYTPKTNTAPMLDTDALRTPAAITADAQETREAELMAALLAEKSARVNDLQKQLDAANSALEREQIAHGETRRALAFAMATPPTMALTAQKQNDPAPPADKLAQQPAKNRRKPRPLWAVLLGVRPKD